MRLTPTESIKGGFLVHVDSHELDCGSKKLPYPTCIGYIVPSSNIVEVWTPAAYKPHGYRAAARLMLCEALALVKVL